MALLVGTIKPRPTGYTLPEVLVRTVPVANARNGNRNRVRKKALLVDYVDSWYMQEELDDRFSDRHASASPLTCVSSRATELVDN